MVFNDSHPIRATITIIWKKKYIDLKKEFENKLKHNCDLSSQKKKKEEILKLVTPSLEFFDKYDIIGELKSHTSKPSYIIKEKLDRTRTSFDLFNDVEHIKGAVKFVRELLKKTIRETKKYSLVITSNAYSWTKIYSLNNVNFKTYSFPQTLIKNLPLLLGWFILPLTKISNSYYNIENNINLNDLDLSVGRSISTALGNLNQIEITASILIILVIYLLISVINWRQKQNVIRF